MFSKTITPTKIVIGAILIILLITNPNKSDFISFAKNNILRELTTEELNNDIFGITKASRSLAVISIDILTERDNYLIFSTYTISTTAIKELLPDINIPDNPKFIGVLGNFISSDHILTNKPNNITETNLKDNSIDIIDIETNDNIEYKVKFLKEHTGIDTHLLTVSDLSSENIDSFTNKLLSKYRGWSLFKETTLLFLYDKNNNAIHLKAKEKALRKKLDMNSISASINKLAEKHLKTDNYNDFFDKSIDHIIHISTKNLYKKRGNNFNNTLNTERSRAIIKNKNNDIIKKYYKQNGKIDYYRIADIASIKPGTYNGYALESMIDYLAEENSKMVQHMYSYGALTKEQIIAISDALGMQVILQPRSKKGIAYEKYHIYLYQYSAAGSRIISNYCTTYQHSLITKIVDEAMNGNENSKKQLDEIANTFNFREFL